MPEQYMLVFEDDSVPVTLEEPATFLVFDDPLDSSLATVSGRDILVFNDEVATSSVELPGSFIVFDEPTPTDAVYAETGDTVLVVTPGGVPGRQGQQGDPGPPGPPGTPGAGSYYQVFGFAVPSTVWTLVHNQNSLALNVEVVDQNGQPLEAYVQFIDPNTIRIDWYYPTAGEARVFR